MDDMIPPGAEGTGSNAGGPDQPPAVSSCLDRIRKRADFLRAAQARRQGSPAFLLQARDRRDGRDETRVGFTCSKKVGNSVMRNRARRRLREIARLVMPGRARAGWDYVLVGRPGVTVERDFALMLADLETALARVHGGGR
jgi:ribonuclease P protein component